MKRTVLDEINEALERATERPWAWEAADASVIALGAAGKVFDTGHVLWCGICPACQKHGNRCTAPSRENAKLIELSVNNVEKFRDVVRAATELSHPVPTAAELCLLTHRLRTLDPRLLGEDR